MRDMDTYRRLAVAVLETAVRDAQSGDVTARQWLREPSETRRLWCQWLKLNDQAVGDRYTRARWARPRRPSAGSTGGGV